MITGRWIRRQSIDTTLDGPRAVKAAGGRNIMFASDSFKRYLEAKTLQEAVIEEHHWLAFFVQRATQIARPEHLVELLVIRALTEFSQSMTHSAGTAKDETGSSRKVVGDAASTGVLSARRLFRPSYSCLSADVVLLTPNLPAS